MTPATTRLASARFCSRENLSRSHPLDRCGYAITHRECNGGSKLHDWLHWENPVRHHVAQPEGMNWHRDPEALEEVSSGSRHPRNGIRNRPNPGSRELAPDFLGPVSQGRWLIV